MNQIREEKFSLEATKLGISPTPGDNARVMDWYCRIRERGRGQLVPRE